MVSRRHRPAKVQNLGRRTYIENMNLLENTLFVMFSSGMSDPATTTLSTVIDARVKRALSVYCKRKGLKVRYVVEEALIVRLEDE